MLMVLYKKYKHNLAPVHMFEINTLIDQTILVASLGALGKIQISKLMELKLRAKTIYIRVCFLMK